MTIRLRTKLYLIATGAYAGFAVVGALAHAGMIMGFSFVMSMFCYYVGMMYLREDVITNVLLNTQENHREEE